MTIQELSPELVEKIAAGEVVERPASVVKELIENALDAHATSVSIELIDAGHDKITVSDNGDGMTAEDLQKSVLTHTTSKITTLDDLFHITTLGFRGEALASIGSVSKLSVTTRQANLVEGNKIAVIGGAVSELEIVGAPKGTSVSIEELFYNVPARRKFLKSKAAELQVISSIVTSYALINKSVSFDLKNNGRSILSSPQVGSIRNKIAHVHGLTIAKSMIPISGEFDGITVEGFTSNPGQTKSDRSGMYFYINGRWIKNTSFVHSVLEGYDTLLMVGRYPLGVFTITLDPTKVDVNVHPSKDIVKFDEEQVLLDYVSQTIHRALGDANLLREYESDALPEQSIRRPKVVATTLNDTADFSDSVHEDPTMDLETNNVVQASQSQSNSPSILAESVSSFQSDIQPAAPEIEVEDQTREQATVSVLTQNQDVLESSENEVTVDTELDLRYIGLIHRTYAVCESKDGAVLIDFHAAHERYLYEVLVEEKIYKERTQALLEPLLLELSPTQKIAVIEYKETLSQLGLIIDEFGEDAFVLRTVPQIFHKKVKKVDVLDIIDELVRNQKVDSLEKLKEAVMIRMSCRAADKAGDELSDERIKYIIRMVAKAKWKYSCPHGRPIFLNISWYELEKMFKRKV